MPQARAPATTCTLLFRNANSNANAGKQQAASAPRTPTHGESLRRVDPPVHPVPRERHPAEMDAAELTAFLSPLAVREDVAGSTQNHARLVRDPPARGRPRHPDRPGTPGSPRRVDDADLHARPKPWPVRRAQPAGRNAGCVISPPFRPGYPPCCTTAPRCIARPEGSGAGPANTRNGWTAGP